MNPGQTAPFLEQSDLGPYCLLSKTPDTFSRRSHGVQEKCRTLRCKQYNHKHHRSNTVTWPVDAAVSHRMLNDGAHFKHALNKRLCSAF